MSPLLRLDSMDEAILREAFSRCWPPDCTVATTAQLSATGLGDKHITAALRLGILVRLRRGVYCPMHLWRGKPPWEQAKITLAGHIAGTSGSLTYSHFSAARLHGLAMWDCPSTIHVNTPYNSHPRQSMAGVVMHSAVLSSDAVVPLLLPGLGAVNVTSLERTVLDCARVAPFDRAAIIGDSAFYKGLQLAKVAVMADTMAGLRGIQRARHVLTALNGLSESAGETRTRLIIAELPIEQPELQVKLYPDGNRHRVDFAWRGIKLILEFDGDTKYFDFGPMDEALIAERERENTLIEDGWRIIRIKWKHLAQPDVLKRRIMMAYQNAVLARAA